MQRTWREKAKRKGDLNVESSPVAHIGFRPTHSQVVSQFSNYPRYISSNLVLFTDKTAHPHSMGVHSNDDAIYAICKAKLLPVGMPPTRLHAQSDRNTVICHSLLPQRLR